MTIFAPPAAPKALTFNFSKAQVLAVDGNAPSMNVLCQILSGFGFRHFLRCTDIEKARPMIASQIVDMVLIDPFNFRQDSHDLIRWLRSERLGANSMAPVLVITGHASVEEIAAAKECGADYIVAKPYSPVVLLERILWVARRDGRGGFMGEHRELVSSEGGGVELW